MRRRAGIGAIHKQKLEAEKYKDKGSELQDSQFEQMTKQMELMKENLEEFAEKHKNEIRKNPTFRRQFTEMCSAIGYVNCLPLLRNILDKCSFLAWIH